MKPQELTLRRTTSTSYKNTRKIIPAAAAATYPRTSSTTTQMTNSDDHISQKLLISKSSSPLLSKTTTKLSSLLRSLLHVISFPSIIPTTCRWLTIPNTLSITPSLGRKVTGTLFGHRRGHVSFAVQDHPQSDPVLLLELATTTSALVREMSSGLVRIALECEKPHAAARGRRPGKLFQEPTWTMYCNGRKCGYSVSRGCTESDWHVLKTVSSVSVGAGVIPVVDDGQKAGACEGELVYMRAKFERVVGSRDSEAFYMLNPDGNGGPELSIFLLRI